MQICRVRRRWWWWMGRISPVIGWQRIFAGRWRRWLVINDSGATSGGPAARRWSASPTGLLIAIVVILPEKIPSLQNALTIRKANENLPSAWRTPARSYRHPFLLCVKETRVTPDERHVLLFSPSLSFLSDITRLRSFSLFFRGAGI